MIVRTRIVIIAFFAAACAGCHGRAGRAARYGPGTPLNVIVSELGPPDSSHPYSDEHGGVDLCPTESARVVNYLGPRVPFLIHGSIASLCLDKSDRVLEVLFSDS